MTKSLVELDSNVQSISTLSHERLLCSFPSAEMMSLSHLSVSVTLACMYNMCLRDWLEDGANARSS